MKTHQEIMSCHEKGYLALHVTPEPHIFVDKLDDRRILNNLRENKDALENSNYQLYTTISATILPPSKFQIRQDLFHTSNFFFGIDIRHCVIKYYKNFDSWSLYYGVYNKHGRPSYKPRSIEIADDISELSQEERLSYVQQINYESAADRLSRPMNELVVKVNHESGLFIGSTASTICNNPSIVLNLITIQKKL